MNFTVLVYSSILFFILSPNILFKVPSNGSKNIIAISHATLFGIVLYFTQPYIVHFSRRILEGLGSSSTTGSSITTPSPTTGSRATPSPTTGSRATPSPTTGARATPSPTPGSTKTTDSPKDKSNNSPTNSSQSTPATENRIVYYVAPSFITLALLAGIVIIITSRK